MPLMVNGEVIEDAEIHDLLRMMRHDVQEIAGCFFENKRSRKFRRHFATEGKKRGMSAERYFVESEWQNFEGVIPSYYAESLDATHPRFEPNEEVRSRRHKALILISLMSQAQNARRAGGVQVMPGTQQFEGDAHENKYISETYGDGETIH